MTPLNRTERVALKSAIGVCDAHPDYSTNDAAAQAMRTMLKESESTGGGSGAGTTPPPVVVPPPVVTPPPTQPVGAFVMPVGSRVFTGAQGTIKANEMGIPGAIFDGVRSTVQEYNLYGSGASHIRNSRLVAVGKTDAENAALPENDRSNDGYCVRHSGDRCRIENTDYDNAACVEIEKAKAKQGKNSLRITGCNQPGSGILNSRGRGGALMIGRGARNETDPAEPFGNFEISGGSFDCTDPRNVPLGFGAACGKAGPVKVNNINITGLTAHAIFVEAGGTIEVGPGVTYNGHVMTRSDVHPNTQGTVIFR